MKMCYELLKRPPPPYWRKKETTKNTQELFPNLGVLISFILIKILTWPKNTSALHLWLRPEVAPSVRLGKF